ncbi:acyltransferase family protein [Chryseobacterium sp. TY3]
MPITPQQSNQLKSLAILMMLCLHLFNREEHALFQPWIYLGVKPLSYYISLFSDACVPIFAFVSGYGLYFKFKTKSANYYADNKLRIKKLYINYWIILILFAVILGWIIGKDGYPGSFQKFILNASGLDPSYNGAWWFFTTYVLFVLTSSFWFRLLTRYNPFLYIGVLLLIYMMAFYIRVYLPGLSGIPLVNYFQNQMALYFCTLFQFMLGAFALEFRWHEKITQKLKGIQYPNALGLLGIIGLIVLHGLVPNFVIAPFTGLAFIFTFLQLKLPVRGLKVLDFFTPHATNIWLIHMFFYMIYFSEFIYSFQYPIVIYLVLVVLCLGSSYIVNFINQKINKWV